MALGQQKERQAELTVDWAGVPRSPGHAFYDRLQAVLVGAGFDGFVEGECAPYYASRRGRRSIPRGHYFRTHLVGYFEGIDSERGLEWRCTDGLSLREFLRLGTTEPVPDHPWSRAARLLALAAIACALVLATSGTRAAADRATATSARPPAPAATRPRRPPGADRTTTSRCRRRRRPRCWATSTTRPSPTAASPRASSRRDGRFFVATDGPDGKLARVRDPLHLRRLPAAAVPDRLPGRPPAGARHRLGRAAEGRRAASAGSTSTRARRSTPAIRCTGPASIRTGTSCAPSATRPTCARTTTPASNTYATTWAEIDVALRGLPRARLGARRLGRQAAAPAPRRRRRRARRPLRRAPGRPWTIDPQTGNAARSAPRTTRARSSRPAACCHARRRRSRRGAGAPGQPLLDTHRAEPARARPVRRRRPDADEVYNYGSFRQSRMFAHGVTCSDCHDPHSLAAARRGQRASAPSATSRRRYDTAAHHHHAGGLAGGAVRRLPHAGAHLHGRRPAPRPRLPHPAARPVGRARHARTPATTATPTRTRAWAAPRSSAGTAPSARVSRPGRAAFAAVRRGDARGRRAAAPARGRRHHAVVARATALEDLADATRARRPRCRPSRPSPSPTRWSGWRRCTASGAAPATGRVAAGEPAPRRPGARGADRSGRAAGRRAGGAARRRPTANGSTGRSAEYVAAPAARRRPAGGPGEPRPLPRPPRPAVGSRGGVQGALALGPGLRPGLRRASPTLRARAARR